MKYNQDEITRNMAFMKYLLSEKRRTRIVLSNCGDNGSIQYSIMKVAWDMDMQIIPCTIMTHVSEDDISVDQVLEIMNEYMKGSLLFINFHLTSQTDQFDVDRMVELYGNIYKNLSDKQKCIIYTTTDGSMKADMLEDLFISNEMIATSSNEYPKSEHVCVVPYRHTQSADIYKCYVGYFSISFVSVDNNGNIKVMLKKN